MPNPVATFKTSMGKFNVEIFLDRVRRAARHAESPGRGRAAPQLQRRSSSKIPTPPF
jgi:hypothetical protein